MFEVKHGASIRIDTKEISEKGEISGYGSTFGNVDNGWDIVERGAFADSLENDGLPKMLWGHDYWEPPIGKWTKAVEDDRGLYMKGRLNLDMQKGREVYSALKMDTLDGLSIGYGIKDDEVDERGIRHIKQAKLYEVSVVTFPMNEQATVDAVKRAIDRGRITKTQLERLLRDAGLSRRQAKALIAEGYDGLITRDATDGSDDDDGLAESIKRLRQSMKV